MATPRKYPTLDEFEELKEAVARIEARLSSKPEKSSVIVDAVEACERIGIVDAYGTPVAVGDEIGTLEGGAGREVREIVLRKATGSCKATLHAACADGSSVTAVDMRLPGHVVTKKGHGVKPWPQTIAGGNPWQERPPSKRKDTTCKPSKPNLATISRMRRQKPRLLA